MNNNEERTLEMLQSNYSSIAEELETCQIQLIEKLRHEKVSKAQEELLQKEAHKLANQELDQKKNLDLIRQEIEQKIETVIREIELACQKRNHSPEADELRRKRDEEHKKRGEKYHRLKGEVEALEVFKEYQDVILQELDENIQKKKSEKP